MIIRHNPPRENDKDTFGFTRYRKSVCLRKVAYKDSKEAIKAARKRMSDGAPQLYWYICRVCRYTHLTHKHGTDTAAVTK